MRINNTGSHPHIQINNFRGNQSLTNSLRESSFFPYVIYTFSNLTQIFAEWILKE